MWTDRAATTPGPCQWAETVPLASWCGLQAAGVRIGALGQPWATLPAHMAAVPRLNTPI